MTFQSSRSALAALFVAAASATAAFSGFASAKAAQTDAPEPRKKTAVSVETFARGLSRPWGLAFLPDGRLLVTEKAGRLRVVSSDGTLSSPVSGLPKVAVIGQGGLLDVAIAPDFETSRWIYLSYAAAYDGGAGTAAARGKLVEQNGRWVLQDVQEIFRQTPATSTGYHFGSRIVFADDGTLWITLGDRGRRNRAQDTDRHWAKIVRVNPDGSVPSDNPFVNRQGVLPEIYSIGHRNAQGAARHPETGELWTVEHGAAGGDEINRVLPGRNYGWAVISYGRHYSGRKIGVGSRKAGLQQPSYYWDPSIAPSGMIFYTGDLFPDWKGDIIVGALKYRMLVRLDVEDGKVVAEERLLKSVGARIRAIAQGPDGALYVATDSADGRILRVAPRNQ